MKTYLLAFVSIVCLIAYGQELNYSTSGFVENKGQIIDTDSEPNKEALYLLNQNGMNVQLRKNGFSYDVYQLTGEKTHSFHRLDFVFVNSNTNFSIEPSQVHSDLQHYYNIGLQGTTALGVRTFGKVVYKDVYPNIDVEFSTKDKGFKYDFIIYEGGNVDDIKIKVLGADLATIDKDGNLLLETSITTVKEKIPLAYYENEGKTEEVEAHFSLDQGLISIAVDRNLTGKLVIDPLPELLKYTYYGGVHSDFINDIVQSSDGSIIGIGFAYSANNIATSGSFQSTHAGHPGGSSSGWSNMFLVKLDSNLSTRSWATYLGGNGLGSGHNLALDSMDNIYFTGLTDASISGFTTTGAYSQKPPPTVVQVLRGIIGCFSSTGIRKWGTYFGEGTLTTFFPNDMKVTSPNNIYVTGHTHSADSMSLGSVHMDSLYGQSDAFLTCFDSLGSVKWSTLLGGEGADEASELAVKSNGNILVVGSTNSHLNIATPGAYQDTIFSASDTLDGFIMEFSSFGQKVSGTYYGGDGDQRFMRLAIDPNDNFYVFGSTNSDLNTFGTPGTEYPFLDSAFTCSTGLICYLSKFQNTSTRLWSTYLDARFEQIPLGVSYNPYKSSVFLLSRSQCCNGSTFPCLDSYGGVSTHSYRQNPKGETYFASIDDQTGQLKWSSFLGESARRNTFTSMVIKPQSVFLGGNTFSDFFKNYSMPAQKGFQPNRGGSTDGIIAKMAYGCQDLCDSATCYSFINDSTVCVEDSIFTVELNFLDPNDKMYGANTYNWTVTGGATISYGQGSKRLGLKPIAPGLVSISVQGVSDCDTSILASVSVTILPSIDTVKLSLSDTLELCDGDTYSLKTTKAYSHYFWQDNSEDSVYNIINPDAYWVLAGNASCQEVSDTLYVVKVPLPPTPTISFNPNGQLVSSSQTGNQWYRNDTLIQGATGQSHTPQQSGSFKVRVFDGKCESLFSLKFDYGIGLDENSGKDNGIAVYPNPNQGEFRIQLPDTYKVVDVKLSDINGKVVYQQQSNTSEDFTLLKTKLPAGMYMGRVSNKGNFIGHFRVMIE